MKRSIKIICLTIILLNICACTTKNETIEKPNPELITKVEPSKEKLFWATNEYTDTIPKFDSGNNKEVYTNDESGFMFGAFDVPEEEHSKYLLEVKKAGYNKKITEVNSEYKSFIASNGKYQLTIGYSDGYLSITIIKETL